jgi:hypothetical protein
MAMLRKKVFIVSIISTFFVSCIYVGEKGFNVLPKEIIQQEIMQYLPSLPTETSKMMGQVAKEFEEPAYQAIIKRHAERRVEKDLCRGHYTSNLRDNNPFLTQFQDEKRPLVRNFYRQTYAAIYAKKFALHSPIPLLPKNEEEPDQVAARLDLNGIQINKEELKIAYTEKKEINFLNNTIYKLLIFSGQNPNSYLLTHVLKEAKDNKIKRIILSSLTLNLLSSLALKKLTQF